MEAAITRTPMMGKHMEFIFVEGHSKDATLDEIKRVIAKYPEKDIRYFVQDGKGKGDAVRKGFELASGDILAIYDADMTVPPEELEKFYDAIVTNKADFANGSRLVYPMAKESMRVLNFFGNNRNLFCNPFFLSSINAMTPHPAQVIHFSTQIILIMRGQIS